MNTHGTHAPAPAHHGDHHEEPHGDDGPHSSLREYLIGFVLSIILTAIPFWLVMNGVISHRPTAVLVLGGFAVAQILVHMVYFLHMNGKVEGGWTLVSTIFTVVFVAIAIAGTLWVMFHMNANMMPAHPTPTPPTHEAPGHSAARGGATGAACTRASTRAMSACFQPMRCTCHTPSATNTTVSSEAPSRMSARPRRERLMTTNAPAAGVRASRATASCWCSCGT